MNMDSEKEGEASRVDQILGVVKIISGVALLIGIGATICGCLTVAFSSPNWDFPYSTFSGVWSGVIVLLQGVFGIVLTQKYDLQNKRASRIWVGLFHGFGQATGIVAGQHLGYSIAGVVLCAVRATRRDGTEKCNADNHDSLIIVNSFGIVFAVLMFFVGFGGMGYLLKARRGATLTGDDNYGRCCGRRTSC